MQYFYFHEPTSICDTVWADKFEAQLGPEELAPGGRLHFELQRLGRANRALHAWLSAFSALKSRKLQTLVVNDAEQLLWLADNYPGMLDNAHRLEIEKPASLEQMQQIFARSSSKLRLNCGVNFFHWDGDALHVPASLAPLAQTLSPRCLVIANWDVPPEERLAEPLPTEVKIYDPRADWTCFPAPPCSHLLLHLPAYVPRSLPVGEFLADSLFTPTEEITVVLARPLEAEELVPVRTWLEAHPQARLPPHCHIYGPAASLLALLLPRARSLHISSRDAIPERIEGSSDADDIVLCGVPDPSDELRAALPNASWCRVCSYWQRPHRTAASSSSSSSSSV